MAKIVKVTIRKQRAADSCIFTWPGVWTKEVAERCNVLAYEDDPINLGARSEGVIAIVPDALAPVLLADPDIKEILVAEANTSGRLWRPQVVRVADEKALVARVIEVLTQLRAISTGNAIKRLAKALDPDDAEPGLGRSPLFDVGGWLTAFEQSEAKGEQE